MRRPACTESVSDSELANHRALCVLCEREFSTSLRNQPRAIFLFCVVFLGLSWGIFSVDGRSGVFWGFHFFFGTGWVGRNRLLFFPSRRLTLYFKPVNPHHYILFLLIIIYKTTTTCRRGQKTAEPPHHTNSIFYNSPQRQDACKDVDLLRRELKQPFLATGLREIS
jgi:hypothetical protein